MTLTRNDAGTVTVSLDGRYYLASNPSGYLTGITSSQVTTALGYTPYNSTNPSGYITGITSSNVTTALGYTPYNSTNPSGYITGITSGNVTTALGYTPYNSTNPSGYITGINSSAVTTALGFTPLSSSGNVTIGGYLTVTGAGTSSSIYMSDTDEGQREIHCNSNRIGFLTQAGAWGAYCDDSGNFFAANLSGTNTGDQTNISGNAATATTAPSGTNRGDQIHGSAGVTPATSFGSMPSAMSGFTDNWGGGDLPSGMSHVHGIACRHFNNSSNNWGWHMVGQYDQPGDLRVRWVNAGTWTGYYQLISSWNIGSQSVSYATTAGSATSATSASYADSIYWSGSQRLYGGSDGTRNTGWAYHNNNGTGLHWPNNGWHLYPINASDFYIRSGASDCSLKFTRNGTTGGYVHCAADNAIGFLTTGRSWSLRVDDSGGGTFYSGLTVKGAIYVDANEDLYLNYNYGCSVVGVYSASRFQGVFAMGNSYKLARDGTSPGSLYGLAWSHPNAGGQAGYLDNHGLLVMLNGTTYSAISNSIWARGDVTAFSDSRVKTNIEVVENAIEKIKAIRGVTFNRTDMEHDTKRHAGVIAQEVLAVLPEVVTTTRDGMHSVAYGNLAALFIEAIKEQQKEIDELKSLINGLTK